MGGRPDHVDLPTTTTAALQEQMLQMQHHMQAMGDVITDMAAASTAVTPGVTAGAAATATGTDGAAPMFFCILYAKLMTSALYIKLVYKHILALCYSANLPRFLFSLVSRIVPHKYLF